MVGTSIRISESLTTASKSESRLMHRSQASQVEHWARIGRAIEHSGQFNYNRIARALRGDLPVDDLSIYEKPVFDAMHDEAMRQSSDEEAHAHERRMADFSAAGIDTRELGD